MRRITLAALIFLLQFPNNIVSAQTDPIYPTYIIQEGDTLSSIASLFGTTVNDILAINQITNADNLSIGTQIFIPGFDSLQGTLELHSVELDETLQRIAITNKLPEDLLIRINRLASPNEFYVGRSFIVPQNDQANPLSPISTLTQNQSILSVAVKQKINPWTLTLENSRNVSYDFLPNEILYGRNLNNTSINPISPFLSEIYVTPLPVYQGSTVQITIITNQPLSISGNLGNYSLTFFNTDDNKYVALQGIGAQEKVGITPINISGSSPNNEGFSFHQNILIYSGNYGEDPPLMVDPSTIDPITIANEEVIVDAVISQVTPEKLWNGTFQYPMDEPCIGADFGGDRVYNGVYYYYHTGVDFTVCSTNTNVYSSATGVIAYTGSTIIRGNAMLIDHGWGVFSGYYHLSQILVSEGDRVEPGQLIGYVGNTGRSTGYHLHWEVWVNGIQVEPFAWLDNVYPFSQE